MVNVSTSVKGNYCVQGWLNCLTLVVDLKDLQEELQEDSRRVLLLLFHQDPVCWAASRRSSLLTACPSKALGGGAWCWQTLPQAHPEQLCHRWTNLVFVFDTNTYIHLGLLEGQEDCLYINVYRPEAEEEEEENEPQELLPVSWTMNFFSAKQDICRILINLLYTRWCFGFMAGDSSWVMRVKRITFLDHYLTQERWKYRLY